MTHQEAENDIFTPAQKMPKPLRDAAAILGAKTAPNAAIRAAADMLWQASLTRRSGASAHAIQGSVGAFVQSVFEHSDDAKANDARRLAMLRLGIIRKLDKMKSKQPKPRK